MQKNFTENKDKKVVVGCREVTCVDEQNLKKTIDDGYVGTSYIRMSDKDFSKNKIRFEKFQSVF